MRAGALALRARQRPLAAQRGAGEWVEVDPRLVAALAAALDARDATGGRYDPTVLPALIAAGYDRSFEQLRPRLPLPRTAGARARRSSSTVRARPGADRARARPSTSAASARAWPRRAPSPRCGGLAAHPGRARRPGRRPRGARTRPRRRPVADRRRRPARSGRAGRHPRGQRRRRRHLRPRPAPLRPRASGCTT